MLLKNKNAIIYGGGGSIGGAVAKAFAKEGARVFLAGRTMSSLEKIAAEIRAAGGRAKTAIADAMDEGAIKAHMDTVLKEAGTVDISFNAIYTKDVQNIPLIDMNLADFLSPIEVGMQTQFLTCTAAGRVMVKQGSGVIISITATPGGTAYPLVGGFGPACCALEGFSRDLAAELGPAGVRVVNIRSAGSPDSKPFLDAMEQVPDIAKTFIKKMSADTMLKQLPMLADIGNTAVYLASPLASKITGITLDITVGTTNALNYKMEAIPV